MKGTSALDQVLEQKGHGGPPAYCRRCRQGPRRLHALTSRGITLARVCQQCVDEIAAGGPLSKPSKE